MTTDGWQTIETAIRPGEIFAKYLVGDVLVGKNLQIISNNDYGFMTCQINNKGVLIDNGAFRLQGLNGGNKIEITPEDGFVAKATRNGKDIVSTFNATDGIKIDVGNTTALSFDTSTNELMINGDIWCKRLYLGQNKVDVLKYIDGAYKIDSPYLNVKGLNVNNNLTIDGNGILETNGSIFTNADVIGNRIYGYKGIV